ncbi:MAG: glycosyltransferase [Caldilineales bacterium]|nr:glycosyltransferase [Caldilineales bacterium]
MSEMWNMRLGVLTHNYPRFDGDFSGYFIQQLCEELARQGDEVHVIAPFDAAYQPQALAGANPRLHLYRYAWSASAHKLGYMRTMEADVRMRLNTYALSPLLFARGIQTTFQVVRRQRLEVLHAHWALPNGFIAAVVSRRLGLPLVVSIPGSDALVAGQNPLFRRMVRFAFEQASLITANAEVLREVAVEELGANPAKFELIIYGVDPNRLRPDPSGVAALRQRLGIPTGAVVFLAVGRMVYKKGFDILLQALAGLGEAGRDCHTILVGEGDLWQEWQELAQTLGLANLHWVGNIPTDQMPAYYNACDALVMPNVRKPATGLGVTVLDAMACGKAIIASDTAGNTLVVEPGVNGLITPEGDAQALAAAMLELARDPARTQRMGQASRQLIETRFGWPHIAAHYRRRFREILP